MKNATPLESKIASAIIPVIEDMGFRLVNIKASGAVGGMTVQIMAENPETRRLGIDDCASLSRAISAVMDVEDLISSSYRLEVSSPGIDRLLVTLKDYEDYKGFEAKVETATPSENGQKKFRGRILGSIERDICLQTDQGEVKIPFDSVLKAKLVLTDELIKATAQK